jgi:hypothetical protein
MLHIVSKAGRHCMPSKLRPVSKKPRPPAKIGGRA